MSPGYSGTPLAKKLGLKSGIRLALIGAPDNYRELFDEFPEDATVDESSESQVDIVHFFVTDRETLQDALARLIERIRPDGMIWISWPKKSSKRATDIDENIIREIAIEQGLVDVKVAAVDDTWSGLKLVIPVERRG